MESGVSFLMLVITNIRDSEETGMGSNEAAKFGGLKEKDLFGAGRI